MTQQIFILKATNSSDFQLEDAILVGTSKEVLEKEFAEHTQSDWDSFDEDSKAFYEDYEKYHDSWRYTIWPNKLIGT